MVRYAVDLDGTLADTVSATLEIFNERYGTTYTKADVTDWHFWNSFPELQMLPESKRKNIILRMMDEAWISGRIRPEPGAAQFMHELTSSEPQVDIVTGRAATTPTDVIERWLKNNDIPYRKLVRVRGSQEKVYHAYDTYIDDDPNLAKDIADRWPSKRIYLVSQPWNVDALRGMPPEYLRVFPAQSLYNIPTRHRGRQERLFRHPVGTWVTERISPRVMVTRHVRRRRR